MNVRKVFGSLAGFVVLAGVSAHQVSDGGPTPADTAVMAGTVLPGRSVARSDELGQCASVGGAQSAGDPVASGPACTGQPRR